MQYSVVTFVTAIVAGLHFAHKSSRILHSVMNSRAMASRGEVQEEEEEASQIGAAMTHNGMTIVYSHCPPHARR